jgi:hypothetical protein
LALRSRQDSEAPKEDDLEPFFEEVSGDDPMAGTSQKWNYLEPTHFFFVMLVKHLKTFKY